MISNRTYTHYVEPAIALVLFVALSYVFFQVTTWMLVTFEIPAFYNDVAIIAHVVLIRLLGFYAAGVITTQWLNRESRIEKINRWEREATDKKFLIQFYTDSQFLPLLKFVHVGSCTVHHNYFFKHVYGRITGGDNKNDKAPNG